MLCGHGSLAMTRMRKGFICADFPTLLHGGHEPRHNITMAMTMMRVMPMMMHGDADDDDEEGDDDADTACTMMHECEYDDGGDDDVNDDDGDT